MTQIKFILQDQLFQMIQCKDSYLLQVPLYLSKLKCTFDLILDILFTRTNWIIKDSVCYKPHAGVIIEVKDDLPVIGKILVIFGKTVFNII